MNRTTSLLILILMATISADSFAQGVVFATYHECDVLVESRADDLVENVLGPVIDQPDPAIERIINSWPTATEADRAETLGITGDVSLTDVIEGYLDDFGRGG